MNAIRFRLVVFVVLALLAVLAGAGTTQATPSSNLVISQVYGGGGNTGAPYTNDFVELFNRGTAAASLNGLSVQYASATGTGNFGVTNQLTVLPNVSLQPGQYFLVQEAGGTTGVALPTPDTSSNINLSGTGGKVALVNGTTTLGCNGGSTPCSASQLAQIVDLIGYDGANFFETAAAPGLSNTTAALRANGGCTDTDNNSTDFGALTPAPRNTATALQPCPTLPTMTVGTAPLSGAPGSDFTISATVTPGANPTSTGLAVSCDLSWASLGSNAPLFDAGGNTFSRTVTVPANATTGTKTGGCTVTDDQSRSGSGVYSFDVVPGTTDLAPAVSSHTPAGGETGVAPNANIGITFTEPVNVSGSWFSILCDTSGSHTAAAGGSGASYLLDPDSDFAPNETCTVRLTGAQISDQDTDDPPDTLVGNPSWSFTTAGAAQIVVSQVYGGGGNVGAQYKNDFIELYNRGTAAGSLNGWSVQYASATGTTWQVSNLGNFMLDPGQHYLVQEAAGAGTAPSLPAPDAIGTINMSATAGKVALVSSTTALSGACPTDPSIIDLVGYGTANCSETAPTAGLSNTTAAIRKAGGATDTNNNSADFDVAAPSPRNSGTVDTAPTVSTETPNNGATGIAVDANITITFSEPVNVTGSWFAISCGTSGSHAASVSGGPTTFTLDPATNFAGGESCTVTVSAANVTDQDSNDPPDNMADDFTFSFQTTNAFACGDPATPIHDVQGSGATSPIAGQAVTIEGVVVGDYQAAGEFGGYYVQEEDADADADPATSEGIFVFSNSAVARGDKVRVRGTVTEFNDLTELSSVNAVAVCSSGNSVTPTHVSLPVADVNDLERYEGMLVDFSQTLTVTEVFSLGRFGEVSLSGAGRLYTPTAVAAPGAPAQAVEAQNNRSRIILDDGNNQQNIDPTRYPQGGLSASNTLRVGDTLQGLTGVMDFRFATYRIQPVGPISFDHSNARTAAPAPVGGNLKVASFNVLNYFNGDGLGGGFPTARGANTSEEFARQRAKEISALKAMNADIVGLMEMENDAPPNSAVEDLVSGLNDAMGAGTYSFINTGVIGGDLIKVALIYKPASVTPVGAYKLMTSAVDPRFVDTLNRPSLAQTFRQNTTGAKLTVVVNHLKSKSSTCAGDPDTGDGQGACNLTRKNAAAALVDWLKTDPTNSGDPDFLLIGDMNSYTFEDPITTFVAGGLENLVRKYDGLAGYSYVFDGESGYLDHALATPSLVGQVTSVEHWHINPDEPTVLDYNTEFKTANQINTFYDAGPYRSSDHDPVLIGLRFNSPPTVSAGGPYSVDEGGSVTLSASGNDPEGGPLSYAWDLDNNGSYETPGQAATFSAAALDGPTTRTVGVQVTDDGGATATSSATVNVVNVPPAATFNAPASSFAGFPFTLSLTSPRDPSAADTAAGFTYSFDCGSGYGAFGPSSTASCPTSDPGPRSVGGKIRDQNGGVSEYRATVNVIVTYESLCRLAQQLVSDPAVAQGLCDKLTAASSAAARGNATAKANQLQAFQNQVDGQTGKSISASDAALLKLLAARL